MGRSKRQNRGDEGCVTNKAKAIVNITANRHAKNGRFDHAARKVTNAGETIKNGKTTNGPKIRYKKNNGVALLSLRQFRNCSFI